MAEFLCEYVTVGEEDDLQRRKFHKFRIFEFPPDEKSLEWLTMLVSLKYFRFTIESNVLNVSMRTDYR